MKICDLLEAKTVKVKSPRKYKLDDDTREMLWYLIHSKTHVWSEEHKDPDMEKVLKKYSKKITKDLYRGVAKDEQLKMFLSKKPLNAFLSFSENKEIAKNFGTVITLKAPSLGFCYWDWVKSECDWLQKNDKFEYDSIDASFLKESAIEEAEWIMPYDMKVKIIDVDNLIFQQVI